MKVRVEKAGAGTYKWVIESERTDMFSLKDVLETMAIEVLSWVRNGGEIAMSASLKISDLEDADARWREERRIKMIQEAGE